MSLNPTTETPVPTWREPAGRWTVIAVALALLVAHKPWGLTTPQLWAEDGPIFLLQNEQHGLSAWFEPYQGYLHLLPRMIAWAASRLVDVAAWPLFYNSATLLVVALLFLRLTSTRITLPGKSWLVLAFALVPHTGEVFLNLTNVQWIGVFFLVAQLFTVRPVTAAQRVGDLASLIVVGLTGPFSVLMLPFFAWRWWHERHRDTLAWLLALVSCAAVQLWFIFSSSGSTASDEARHTIMFGAVPGSRLVVWTLFGPRAAAALSPVALAALGGAIFGAVAVWSLRPHPRREQRALVLGALVLFTAAGAWRSHVDTWAYPDLVNGDRYFFPPRVLLAWLLIWLCDAHPRPVAWTARALCVLAVALELPHHRLPAPPDYHWAEQCDAIRGGVPADIPTLPEGWVFKYPGKPARKLPAPVIANLRPAFPSIAGEVRFQFPEGGNLPGDPLRTAAPARVWSSWDATGAATGSLAFGPFPAPEHLWFVVGGYPCEPGNHLFIELATTGKRLDARPPNPGSHWQLIDLSLPETWRGQLIRLIAVDGATTPNSWLAVSEPLQARQPNRSKP